MEDFIENIRSEFVTQLPPDGTVHELTVNVLVFLEQLLEYAETIGGVLLQDASYSATLDKIKHPVDRNNALLGVYISKTAKTE